MCDQVPTTRGRRLVNGQIPTLANRLHISPSKIILCANIGPTISTQWLGCSRWPNVGRTLACQLRCSTNHADHVPTLDQRLVADWVKICLQTCGILEVYQYRVRVTSYLRFVYKRGGSSRFTNIGWGYGYGVSSHFQQYFS